jgi:formate-dependent nitrite reductase membrane component NrfD
MMEEILSTARFNDKIDPSLGIWTWEIAFYLFLGGMTAGILIFAAITHLVRRTDDNPFTAWRLPLWAPIVLSAGMTTLFLDLEYKLHVFRFYTTLQPASPMSWGSWVLLLVYPASLLLIAATLRQGYPGLARWAERLPLISPLLDMAERQRYAIALWTVPIAVALGIYTGILLSGFSARPFWNTSILGPLFLMSGMSAAAAAVLLFAKSHRERHLFVRVDIVLILIELLLIGLLVIGLASGAEVQLRALEMIAGGEYTVPFWVWFVGIGLLVPLLLELWELRRPTALALIAPILILAGGYLLRHLVIDLGQLSTWTDYAVQFDPALLERLYTTGP